MPKCSLASCPHTSGCKAGTSVKLLVSVQIATWAALSGPGFQMQIAGIDRGDKPLNL